LAQEVSCFDGIAVGLMPLDDDPWARGKCAFKAIQYMALGIPAVASPVGANREVIRDGETGFLPADEREWVETLDRLLADPALARRIGAAGRREIEARYSLDVISTRLVAILRSLVATRVEGHRAVRRHGA
jgi:glycosyltransferase involved in cell wall biosynthesis